MSNSTCNACGRRNVTLPHCVFPSVDRITGVVGRLATKDDAMPLFDGAEERRARSRAIRAQNRMKAGG